MVCLGVPEPADIPLILERLRAVCESAATLGLATTGADGRPHAANVNFVEDDRLNLYFLSGTGSTHSRDIARDKRVAATAYVPFSRSEEIRGIQVRGVCEQLPDEEFDRIWQLFVRKFPYAAALEARARGERFYRITPSWFRLTDNSAGFGTKWEIDWP
jgi:uncharacterized protein YhbP (UPF0306 family)